MKKKKEEEPFEIGIWALLIIALSLMQPQKQDKVINIYMDGDK